LSSLKKKIPLASQGMKKKYPLLPMIIQAYQIIIPQFNYIFAKADIYVVIDTAVLPKNILT
jgi:hypothetical protein